MIKKIKINLFDRIDYAMRFWGFTILSSVFLIPLVIMAYLNPFWFRNTGLEFVRGLIMQMVFVRNRFVQPIINKYKPART